ncbi:MAG: alpha/beta hydrolase [Akkermansiaceae bacterium]|nr:alpha/beta hydrolase [Armatimonadota bacterium]
MPFLETTGGVRLFYHDWGAGRPVVFVHGWTIGADSWEYQTTFLASHGLRCVAYDQRGGGRSDQPWDGYDYDTLADDLATVMGKLDLWDVTLVGHSMGCAEIARYLSRHGSRRVAKTVLLAPTTPCLVKTPDNPDGVDRTIFYGMLDRLLSDRPRYLADIAPGFFGQGLPGCDVSPEMAQWGIDLAQKASLRASIELFRTNAEGDLRADMDAFTMPTLIIHGTADTTAPIELTARKTAAAIKDSRLTIYENAPHGLFLTHAERVNRDLLAFTQE